MLCVGPLVTLAVFGLTMLCRPFGDLSLTCYVALCYVVWLSVRAFGDHVWLCYVCWSPKGFGVGPLVTLPVFGYVM